MYPGRMALFWAVAVSLLDKGFWTFMVGIS
jgi:hypothetical protein